MLLFKISSIAEFASLLSAWFALNFSFFGWIYRNNPSIYFFFQLHNNLFLKAVALTKRLRFLVLDQCVLNVLYALVSIAMFYLNDSICERFKYDQNMAYKKVRNILASDSFNMIDGIYLIRKVVSKQMHKRTWFSLHGVM